MFVAVAACFPRLSSSVLCEVIDPNVETENDNAETDHDYWCMMLMRAVLCRTEDNCTTAQYTVQL